MIDVGKMIASIRIERGYSQQQLAVKLGITKQAVSNYERGIREPDYETLEAIADVLNVPMSMLISSEDQEAALQRIYSTYSVPGANQTDSMPPIKAGKWIMLTKCFGKMDMNEFDMWFNAISANHPDILKEGNDNDDPRL